MIMRKFFSKNVLEILRFLKLKTKIDLYPDQFKNRFLIYLFYTTLFLRQSYINYKKGLGFLKKTRLYEEIKVIYGLPRSGNHFINQLILSYLEQLHSKGDGNIKIVNNSIQFNIKNNTYFSLIDLVNGTIKDELFFDKNLFSGTHFPSLMTQAYGNLNNLNKIKKIILIRDPLFAILSFIIRNHKNEIIKNKFNEQSLFTYYLKYKSFYMFWDKDYFKNNNNLLVIKYEDLVNNTKEQLIKIFQYFDYKINEDFIDKSIKINDYQTVKKNLLKVNPELISSSELHNIEEKNTQFLKKKISEILKKDKFNFFGYDYR